MVHLVVKILAAIPVSAVAYLATYLCLNTFLLPFRGKGYKGLSTLPLVPMKINPLNLLFGQLLAIMREPPGDPHVRLHAFAREQAKRAGVETVHLVRSSGMALAPRLHVVSSQAAHELMGRAEFVKPTFLADTLRVVVGDGLLLVEGEEHTAKRRLIAPSFHHGSIKRMNSAFEAKARELMAVLEEESARGDVDLAEGFQKMTLDVIGIVAFGHSFQSLSGEDELRSAYSLLMDGMVLSYRRMFKLFSPQFIRPLFNYIPDVGYVAQKRALKAIHDAVGRIISEKRAKKAGDDVDLLSSLLSARDENGEGLTDAELKNEVLTFILAGHETSSVTLTWTCLLLDQNPQALAKLRTELHAWDSTGDLAPEVEDRLPYLDAVIKESMRLKPAAPVTVRVATKDTTLAGTPIPAGVPINVAVIAFNTDPEIWGPDTLDFKPERFLATLTDEQKRSYFPFWSGTRSCIGKSLALQEMRVVLALFVRKFDFHVKPGHDTIGQVKITMRPKFGCPVTLTKREK
jgi:cytochrome P450